MASHQNSTERKNTNFPTLLSAHQPDWKPYESRRPSLPQNGGSDRPIMGDSIYENVLKFPSGTEHLKYFGYNPHPDKISDECLLFAEPFLYEDLNEPLLKKQIQFQIVKDRLWPLLSEKERRMMLLPKKLDKYISQIGASHTKTALAHLRNAFLTYFSTSIDDSVRPDIQWIDFNFAAGYGRARDALKDLEKNLFNTAARKKLEEKLLAAGAFGDKRQEFYFWNTDPHNWSDISYQSRSVIHGPWWNLAGLLSPVNYNASLKPQYIALGDFNINAIPEGYVQPKGPGKYEICVKNVYFFINDIFNFETNEYLGEWDLNEEDDYKLWGYTPLTHLFNSDFRNFKRHGYGPDFPVLSRLHRSENFKPDCWEISHAK